MPKSGVLLDETERIARVITRCYSPATLALSAQELGAQIAPGVDIFRALVVAKIATDFDDAVQRVATHLDRGLHEPKDACDDLVDGKIERRRILRAR